MTATDSNDPPRTPAPAFIVTAAPPGARCACCEGEGSASIRVQREDRALTLDLCRSCAPILREAIDTGLRVTAQ